MKTYYLVDPSKEYPTRYPNLKVLMDTVYPNCTLVSEADVGNFKHLPITKLNRPGFLGDLTF